MTQLFKLSCLIVIALFIGYIRLHAYNNVTEISNTEKSDSVDNIVKLRRYRLWKIPILW